MIFKGDLNRYHPGDILMFLSHLNSNGILSIVHNDQVITVSFKDGKVVDAQSAKADEKMLRIFLFKKFINADQLKRLNQLKQETGMSIRLILDELKIDKSPAIREVLKSGIKEAILEYFLMESGNFNFTDVVIDVDPDVTALDCQGIAIGTASQVDEWREIEKNLFSLESQIYAAPAITDGINLTDLEKSVLEMAEHKKSLRHIVEMMPCLSHTGLKVVEDLYKRKRIRLKPPIESILQRSDEATQDELFLDFQRAVKKILSTNEIRNRISALISFCKNYFDQILVLGVKEPRILQCKVMTLGEDGTLQQKTPPPPEERIETDSCFHTVYKSGISYLGNAYPSTLLKSILDLPEKGECAIVPVGKHQDITLMLYVVNAGEQNGLGALHYLGLLSWLFSPSFQEQPEENLSAGAAGANVTIGTRKDPSLPPAAGSSPILQLVEKVDELPPLPSIVFQVLDLLADPEFSIHDLERLIGRDQSLVANLIKVSNSVLYGGIGQVHSLREALTRLGSRTIKSLVLITSTRNFFPETKSDSGSSSRVLWHHSVECGLAAQRVAAMIRYHDPEEAFVGGILHDIGKLVILLKMPDSYRQIQAKVKAGEIDERDAESEVLGFDHAMIGEILMKKWKMPSHLKDCVQLHHNVEIVDSENLLVPVVAYGNCLSHAYSFHAEITQIKHPEETDSLARRLKLTDDQVGALKEELIESFQNNDVFD